MGIAGRSTTSSLNEFEVLPGSPQLLPINKPYIEYIEYIRYSGIRGGAIHVADAHDRPPMSRWELRNGSSAKKHPNGFQL